MDYDGGFIMQKTVDRSMLNDGRTISMLACALLKSKFHFEFANGEVLKLRLYEHLKI